MSILLVGVNHKTAPVEIRERLAFNDEACAEGLRRLVDGEIVREGLIGLAIASKFSAHLRLSSWSLERDN